MLFYESVGHKQGELLTPGETTPDFDCKLHYTSIRAQSPTSKQRRQYNCDGFFALCEKIRSVLRAVALISPLDTQQ